MAASNTPTQSIIDKMPPAQYMPTPEEEEALQAIPRSFLKFGALGFAGGAVVTHFSISSMLNMFLHFRALLATTHACNRLYEF